MSSSASTDPTRTGRRPLGADAEADGPDKPVRRVGKYRILSELGRGGMANVFLAVAHGAGGVNKLVVLKALLPELSAEPDALAMFLDEARLAARLNHANVVQTYEVGTEGDRHVIVMEYLEGQAFSSVLKRAELSGQTLSIAIYLRVVINALEGLHYAHELCDYDGSSLALVHRDVSPQNIFLTYDGQVKVLDFGIAKAATSSTNTATGVVKGKIAYMAPEQMIGDQVDRRADIYSVGCMLWAAATGKKLWKDTSDVQIMRRVINGETPAPNLVNTACDDELSRIVMKALASNRDERYATALELQSDLERYCEAFSSVVKQKQIGTYVSVLFADTRSGLRALVERQLTLVGEAQEFSRTTDRGSAPSAAGVGVSVTADGMTGAASTGGRWSRLAKGAAAAGVAAALLAVMVYAFRSPEPPPVTTPTATRAAEPAPTPAAPELAKVRLEAS
ncbi:MAG TPA: serine/threonine-protein kinase, partial [Polyangiaceae bacterium]|nr:serine/threonine-protein kinase [Polyangiaceae bacterium]